MRSRRQGEVLLPPSYRFYQWRETDSDFVPGCGIAAASITIPPQAAPCYPAVACHVYDERFRSLSHLSFITLSSIGKECPEDAASRDDFRWYWGRFQCLYVMRHPPRPPVTSIFSVGIMLWVYMQPHVPTTLYKDFTLAWQDGRGNYHHTHGNLCCADCP